MPQKLTQGKSLIAGFETISLSKLYLSRELRHPGTTNQMWFVTSNSVGDQKCQCASCNTNFTPIMKIRYYLDDWDISKACNRRSWMSHINYINPNQHPMGKLRNFRHIIASKWVFEGGLKEEWQSTPWIAAYWSRLWNAQMMHRV